MIKTSPKGHKIRVFKTKIFTFGFAAHFNGCFISIRDPSQEALLLHELTHFDQMKAVGFFDYLKMFYDMDYLVKNEVLAYRADKRFKMPKIARIISSQYRIGLLWGLVAKIAGTRTKKYSYVEVLEIS